MAMARLLLVVCLLWGRASSASPEGSWSVLISTSSPEDEELVGRIRGQVSDLPVKLLVRPGPSPGATPEQQWSAAEALVPDGSARVVLWFSYPPEELSVHLADLTSRRLLVRGVPVDARRGHAGRSAAAEAAALIVRSALSALAEGVLVGEPVADPLPTRSQALEPLASLSLALPPVYSEPLPPAPPPPATPPRSSAWVLDVGWQGAMDGQSPAGQQGAQVGLGWESGRWRARVQVLASLPAHLSDEYTQVALSRHAVGVEADAALVSTRRWRLGAGLGVGLAGFLRSTTAQVSDVEPTSARLLPVPYGGPQLAARWRGGAWALEASLAMDVLAGVPTLVYQQEGEIVVRNRLWQVQPRAGLAILLDLR